MKEANISLTSGRARHSGSTSYLWILEMFVHGIGKVVRTYHE